MAEQRAAEPILPLRLFRRNVFSVSAVLSFIVGFALLGCMTFLPTYLQYCQGVSATVSGLRTLPMVLGLIVASVSAGNVVSHTGRYRIFPIVGSVVMAVGHVVALAARPALHDPRDLRARCWCSESGSACRCRC